MNYSGLPIWFGNAEQALFNNLGRELVEHLIVQHFTLYRIDVPSMPNDFYGENKNKVWLPEVEVKARIQIADTDVIGVGGVRRLNKGDMSTWIYLEHMNELDVNINVGDFIGYSGKFYEVYDAGYDKDSLNRKFAGDREFFREILAKSVPSEVFYTARSE